MPNSSTAEPLNKPAELVPEPELAAWGHKVDLTRKSRYFVLKDHTLYFYRKAEVHPVGTAGSMP